MPPLFHSLSVQFLLSCHVCILSSSTCMILSAPSSFLYLQFCPNLHSSRLLYLHISFFLSAFFFPIFCKCFPRTSPLSIHSHHSCFSFMLSLALSHALYSISFLSEKLCMFPFSIRTSVCFPSDTKFLACLIKCPNQNWLQESSLSPFSSSRHLLWAALGAGLAQSLSACQSLRLARSWRTCIIQETALCLLPKQDTHDLNCLRKFRSSGLDSALHLMWQLCADFRNLSEPKTRIRNRNIKNKVKSTKT